MANTIGIRREDVGRIGEQRSPIAPSQVRRIVQAGSRVLVQPAKDPDTGARKRIFNDNDYVLAGAELREDLSAASVIFGLKEVEVANLLPARAYLFFSHTHKGQAKNRGLLRAMIDAGTTLIDYELIADAEGRRLLTTFTYFAGYAGIVDTLWTFGKRLALEGIDSPFSEIPQSIVHPDLAGIRAILKEVGHQIDRHGTPDQLPPVIVCILGRGKTSAGAQELLDLLPVQNVSLATLPDVIRAGSRNRVYKLVLEVDEMYRVSERHAEFGERFQQMDQGQRIGSYLENPEYFESNMRLVLPYVSILVNSIAWSPKYPRTITEDLIGDVARTGLPLRVIGDITCDPNGSIEFSRETWIDDPVFTYEPGTRRHYMAVTGTGINVMAVTNLPCEFSRDASIRFSQELERFLPELLGADFEGQLAESGLRDELQHATILWRGHLTPDFAYMQKFLATTDHPATQ